MESGRKNCLIAEMPAHLRTYYEILGVPFGASEGDIKRRYRELAKKYHPDVNPSPEAAQRMQELNEAYRVLTDPRLRLAYHMRVVAYTMRQRRRASAPVASPASAEVHLPAYLRWVLAGLLGFVVLSAVLYHWTHPFVVQRATLSGYEWAQWPAYLHLPLTIEVLNLSRNRFAVWPTELKSLPALRVLDLSHNRLTYLPASIAQQQQLEELYLAGNQIVALPLGLGELARLRRIDLRNNALQAVPTELFLLPMLEKVDLRGNPLSPEMRRALAYWQQERPELQIHW